ncbi:uncharacterized protein MELLADRAFT_85615 [Melampsora larici-populina 98AG31]|uniref:Uncharacterized protein n=1 Tax=Melampsora larici-populina (strain 98AG31 / pathotype 3-4-7) TaxID=747676 RepID=F4SDC0_MELLP|nr:uncharacterized protein MELLADRAFT_85615 [Melampsora larici-populina 98AG31]EGF97357.1 hypothetical protein MELLADRAFT_85615 [Melampsora larici-populina 98AG31]
MTEFISVAFVQHNFVAERPDEVDAKRGEPIIGISRSNHQWSELNQLVVFVVLGSSLSI